MAALCPPALWREQLVQLLCGRESDLGVVLWAPSPDPVRGFGSPVITLPRAETRVKSVLFHFPKMLRPGSRLLIHGIGSYRRYTLTDKSSFEHQTVQ